MKLSTFARQIVAYLVVGFGGLPALAQSNYDITVQQVGNNVLITGSGSFDLTGLGLVYNENLSASGGLSGPYFSVLEIGSSNSFSAYTGLSGPSSDSFIFGDFAPSTNSGVFTGVQGDGGYLYVPEGYISGAALGTSTSIYDNTTIAGLDLVPGTYTWSWVGGDITLSIPSSVPEPTSLAALGAGLLGLVVARTRKLA